MNIILINANTSKKMYFVLNNNHRFTEIPFLPEEIIKQIRFVVTTKELVGYAKKAYSKHTVLSFEKGCQALKNAGRSSEDAIIYAEYGLLGHINNWLTQMIPFNQEIYRA